MPNGQPDNPGKWPATVQEPRERKIIFLLCVLAAVHVFIFSAGFPFFNNVDEPAHFDQVLKYAHGHVPHAGETFSPEAAPYLVFFMAGDFFSAPDSYADGKMPTPVWAESPAQIQRVLEANGGIWRSRLNYEVTQPPLYYALGGAWWHAGRWLGLQGGRPLYWLRFLNIPLIFALVLLGHFAARMLFPDVLFLRLGVPALVAAMPQTAFYSIGNDILSPLCFGVVFICVLKWLASENPSVWLGAFTGLAVAATYLSKTTNLPLLAVAGAGGLVKAAGLLQRGQFRAAWPAMMALLAAAAPPVLAWMMWCRAHFGDLTGSKFKTEYFGWTVKPFAEWWHHPLFTLGGLWAYLSGQLGTFWQGEFSWHNQRLMLPGSNAVYTILSLALLVAALPALLPKFSRVTSTQRRAMGFSLACLATGLVFFALSSIVYDFHNCPNPSREHPYFQAGRMLLGALIPFMLLMVFGLDRLTARFGSAAKFIILATLILVMLASEIATDWPVFSSPFNWFHLP